MVSDPAINVCIVIARLFPVVFAQPVVSLVKKVFDYLRFEGQRADDRDRKFVSIGWAHLGKWKRQIEELRVKESARNGTDSADRRFPTCSRYYPA
jgi:hypothetical protein